LRWDLLFNRADVQQAIAAGNGAGRSFKGYNAYNEALAAWNYSATHGFSAPPISRLPRADFDCDVPAELPRESRGQGSRYSTPVPPPTTQRSSPVFEPSYDRYTESSGAHRSGFGESASAGPLSPSRHPPPAARGIESDARCWVIIRGRQPGIYTDP
jgi:hypothetical protein